MFGLTEGWFVLWAYRAERDKIMVDWDQSCKGVLENAIVPTRHRKATPSIGGS